MMILITGANGSGKSAFAESLVSDFPGKRVYLATMVAETAENRRRVEKHRRQRAGMEFATRELPWHLEQAKIGPADVVLLEDVSNLLANGLFAHGGNKEQALEQILNLERRCGVLLVVSISGLSEKAYSGETAAYIRDLHWLNTKLLEAADEAYEMGKDGAKWIK